MVGSQERVEVRVGKREMNEDLSDGRLDLEGSRGREDARRMGLAMG